GIRAQPSAKPGVVLADDSGGGRLVFLPRVQRKPSGPPGRLLQPRCLVDLANQAELFHANTDGVFPQPPLKIGKRSGRLTRSAARWKDPMQSEGIRLQETVNMPAAGIRPTVPSMTSRRLSRRPSQGEELPEALGPCYPDLQ